MEEEIVRSEEDEVAPGRREAVVDLPRPVTRPVLEGDDLHLGSRLVTGEYLGVVAG